MNGSGRRLTTKIDGRSARLREGSGVSIDSIPRDLDPVISAETQAVHAGEHDRANGALMPGGGTCIRQIQVDAARQREDVQAPAARILADERMAELAARAFVRRVVILPDYHWKKKMELPSSVALASEGYLVPDATSVALNDCMSVVCTRWSRESLDRVFLHAFFEQVNVRAAASRSALTKYSPSRAELVEILQEGAAAALRKYALPVELLAAIESRGRSQGEAIPEADLHRLVPPVLRRAAAFRAEFGLNFGGNHFLELQYVSDIVQPEVARLWSLFPGQVVLMTHLGPGPFTGNLMHLYSRRQKVSLWRRPLYFALKASLHGRIGKASLLRQRYRCYLRPRRFQGIAADSEVGRDLSRVIQIGSNFGFGYQVGCYAAVIDALNEAARQRSLPDPDPRWLCCVPHNQIVRESYGGQPQWVARHNCARAEQGRPTVLAGRGDVESCLGVGLGGGDEFLRSYDHGVAALLDRAEQTGNLPLSEGTGMTFFFARGRQNALQRVLIKPLRSRQLVEQTMSALEQHRITQPVCYLRPLATMHN